MRSGPKLVASWLGSDLVQTVTHPFKSTCALLESTTQLSWGPGCAMRVSDRAGESSGWITALFLTLPFLLEDW